MKHKLLVLLLLLYGCSTTKKYSRTNFSDEYQPEHYIDGCRAWNFSSDSSRIYIEISRDELLHKNSEGRFMSDFSLNYILTIAGDNKNIADSSTDFFNLPYDSSGNIIALYKNLHAAEGKNYQLLVTLNDLNRNQQESIGISVLKKDNHSSQYFNYSRSGRNLTKNSLAVNTSLTVHLPDADSPVTVRCYFREFPLALPPFSNDPMPTFDFHSDSAYNLPAGREAEFNPSKTGIYFFQYDTLSLNGLSFFVTDENYPEFTYAAQLIESLRYLCTRKEYDKLMSSPDRKKAVDEYWLDKAGNNERGRKLIKIYYGRARQANVLFTSYLEGWKSDRGMIYMIFGPPSYVYRDLETEIWSYDFAGGMPDVTFSFNKIKNPFSLNDFQLQRSDVLQNIWYMAVDSWRSGRIVGEY